MSTETSPIWITDAGLETWLIFHRGVELRDFAAFELLRTADGRAALTAYYTPFFEIAAEVGKGLVLETPTWRASADWGARLDYSEDDLAEINAMSRISKARQEVKRLLQESNTSECLTS